MGYPIASLAPRLCLVLPLVVGVLATSVACASRKALGPGQALTSAQREDMIRRAAVWTPTDVAAMDFENGPPNDLGLGRDAWVECDYSAKDMSGASPKFTCVLPPDRKLKVKYGSTNPEVFGEVLATRLLWGLGFPTDAVLPVKVRCRGCSPDPARDPKPGSGTQSFDPAAVEQKLPGRTLETYEDSGWDWAELDDIGPEAPENARAHRDALKLLAALIQHGDSRAANQRLLCPPGEDDGALGCKAPLMIVHDVGLTFGKATRRHKNASAVDLDRWEGVPVWRDQKTCVAYLKDSFFGRFHDPVIREGGRSFLADLLERLSDDQLHDLFEVARVPERQPKGEAGADGSPAAVGEWVRVFKAKRAEITAARCPE